jgi:predicted double-glycine peptidase
MMSFREWLVIREGVIKTPVPPKPQEESSSCGAGALRSVLHYFGINKTEEEIRKVAKTNEEGTRTKNLIKAARHFGLETKAKYNMDEQDLKDWLDEKKPVIVCFQAWGHKKYYKTKESGHYAVVIGYDEDNVYFQDPNIKTKSRGHLPWKEFVKRWHDKDSDTSDRDRYGIAMWKPGARKKKEVVKRSKKIK